MIRSLPNIRSMAFGLAVALSLPLLGGLVGPASAAQIDATLVVKGGDALGPSVVSGLNTPYTDGNGKVGFLGTLLDSQRFIWWDTGPVFLSGDAPDTLTGGESNMGVSDTGGFIYSPSANGEDAVYTHGGILLRGTDPVPPLPGLYSTFNSRPQMLPDGTAYWIGGTSTTPGGSSTNRHLFRASDPTDPNTITRVLGGGDVIEGKTIRTTASNFDFWISDNSLHHIHVLDMNVTLNEHVYLDGAFVAQEGGPTGDGDNWATFDIVGVNNDGHYIFTGDTDGATTTDEFVAYDGDIVVREGDTLDGHLLLSGYTLRAAAINDLNQVAHIWGSTLAEHLFFGTGSDLGNSRQVLALGDSVEVTGDGIADYRVIDFNASTVTGPGLDLAEDGFIFVHVDLIPVEGGVEVQAVLKLPAGPGASQVQSGGEAGPPQAVLLPSRPNPFRVSTSIQYQLARESQVSLTIHDLLGRQIRVLHTGFDGPGIYERSWDGLDADGRRVAAGTYFIRLRTGESSRPQRLVLLN